MRASILRAAVTADIATDCCRCGALPSPLACRLFFFRWRRHSEGREDVEKEEDTKSPFEREVEEEEEDEEDFFACHTLFFHMCSVSFFEAFPFS